MRISRFDDEPHKNANKLTVETVAEIKTFINDGVKGKDIAKKFNIAPSMVSNIKTGKYWSHVPAKLKGEK